MEDDVESAALDAYAGDEGPADWSVLDSASDDEVRRAFKRVCEASRAERRRHEAEVLRITGMAINGDLPKYLDARSRMYVAEQQVTVARATLREVEDVIGAALDDPSHDASQDALAKAHVILDATLVPGIPVDGSEGTEIHAVAVALLKDLERSYGSNHPLTEYVRRFASGSEGG